jgi:fucose permease
MARTGHRALGLLALSFLGFVSLGLPDGLLGVAWPSIRATFDLPLGALGPLLVMQTAGYVASSAASGRILARTGIGALLALSCLATATSLLGYAAAPAWWVMVALAALAGLGAGAIDAGINTFVATRHGPRTLNWLHACYGLGAAAGPLLVTTLLMMDRPWRSGYAAVGLGQLALAACFAATLRAWPRAAGAGAPAAAGGRAAPASARETLRLRAAWLGIAAFFVYTGIEAAAGAWLFSLFTEGRGFSPMLAGPWVSAYWGALMAGRLLFGLAVGAGSLQRPLRLALLALAVAAGLVALRLGPGASLFAVVLLGLAAGPVFPSLVSATPMRVGEAHAANAIGFQVAAAALGQSLLPAAVGLAAGRLGLEVVGPILLAAALLLVGIHELLAACRAPRPAEPASSASSASMGASVSP